uniref:Uncharacterized protein n=1 Tax=Meloidogyne enterolobii TaxID=390850 RepID=A0A6V7WA55_MELEN|nr:unnamed protein product [Meloidogyne enterolobii]
MNSQSLIILSILFALVMLFSVESVTSELDAVELMTHHLQKRHCFCGPLDVPCACAVLNTEMTEGDLNAQGGNGKRLQRRFSCIQTACISCNLPTCRSKCIFECTY